MRFSDLSKTEIDRTASNILVGFLNLSKLCLNGEKERYSEMFLTEARERFIVESIARGADRLVRHENLQKNESVARFDSQVSIFIFF